MYTQYVLRVAQQRNFCYNNTEKINIHGTRNDLFERLSPRKPI